MLAFTPMKTTLQEEATIPKQAIHAFAQAFLDAKQSDASVVYVKNDQLVSLQHGKMRVIKDVSDAYTIPQLKHSVLKRKKKIEVMA